VNAKDEEALVEIGSVRTWLAWDRSHIFGCYWVQ